MRHAILFAALATVSAPATTQTPGGAFTVVESGRSFNQLDQALASLAGGDGTIRIAPGRYRDCAVQDSGRVSFVAEKAGTAIFDSAICEGKATLVLRGAGSRVDGLVFMHTVVNDGNGAGIRIEKGDLVVTNAMFIDGQCGILSASDPVSTITIDRSTFAGLGKDPTGNGAHSVYIGDYASLKITRSRFERGAGGHYVKSRAKRIEVLDSSFDDTAGQHTNYLIDLPNGAVGRISGNAFVNGPNKDNYSTMITVAPEGVKQPSAGLLVENNRAWLSPDFKWSTTFVGNWSGEAVVVRNNELAERIKPIAARWF